MGNVCAPKAKDKKILVSQFIDPQRVNLKDLVLNGSTIKSTGKLTSNNVFGKNRLKGQSSFNAKFTKIYGFVALGAIDIRNKYYETWNRNSVSYSSYGACFVCDQHLRTSRGFKKGEKVTVSIDMDQGTIKWIVDSEIRQQAYVPMFKDKSIIWVPYLVLLPNQSVQISI